MRRRRSVHNNFGMILVALGVLIILWLILPSGFWWLALGIGLVVIGASLSKRC